MVVNKRKKNSRQRGSHTHGWGTKKSHRGAGSRGGRGLAGTGKRGDQLKTLYWKERYFGKKGFKKKGYRKLYNIISLGYLEDNLDSLLSKKLISKEGDAYSVDLGKMGYDKLLSNGAVRNKFKITVNEASAKAIEKVESRGGEVIAEVSGTKDSQKSEKGEGKGQ